MEEGDDQVENKEGQEEANLPEGEGAGEEEAKPVGKSYLSNSPMIYLCL
jgi:hypothetical protein